MSQKMTIVFLFKSGKEVRMKCDKFETERNERGLITSILSDGATENKVIHVDMQDVSCIYRVFSDEIQENEP